MRKVTHARKRNPWRIVTNFCTGVGVHDVITSANFYDCRLWGLSVVGGQILGFSIDLRRRPYNTLALRCECVIYPLAGVWGNQELPLFILEPPHISQTNRSRKLKFGTLIGICRYYG